MSEWQPIETGPMYGDEQIGIWMPRCLLGKQRSWGWEAWVGQLDADDLWLGRNGNGSCFETDKPTHWMPLPIPPL